MNDDWLSLRRASLARGAPVRGLEILDTPLRVSDRLRLVVRRFWRWLEEDQPRQGRKEVQVAKDSNRLVPPGLEVRVVGDDIIVARARPKVRMSLRVYRVATGKWSELTQAESVEIGAKEEKDG